MVATAHLHQISTCFLRAVSRDMKIKRRVCYKINKPLSDLLVFRLIRLKDCPKNFTFSLEVLLLGQMFLIFGQHFSGGHHEPIYQPPKAFIYKSVVSQNKRIVRAVQKSSNDYSCIDIGYQRIRSCS